VPGIPRNDPPWNGGKQKGHKRAAEVEARQAKIKAAMERMPQLIADYRVSWGGGHRGLEGGVFCGEIASVRVGAGCARARWQLIADWRVSSGSAAASAHGGGGVPVEAQQTSGWCECWEGGVACCHLSAVDSRLQDELHCCYCSAGDLLVGNNRLQVECRVWGGVS
jgi:hypothetical protein